jgi:hypothetical protein
MKIRAVKTLKNKNQPVNGLPKEPRNGEAVFQLIDNRPEAIVQFSLQETLQGKLGRVQQKGNNNGLPDILKTGIENLSGMSMDDVKVHYSADKPTQLKAQTYAQGVDIDSGFRQEKRLPHEAWHVVQQKQGRVKPIIQVKADVAVNDSLSLEREADEMGDKALGLTSRE